MKNTTKIARNGLEKPETEVFRLFCEKYIAVETHRVEKPEFEYKENRISADFKNFFSFEYYEGKYDN